MELETLLTGTKWDILELLSRKRLSPIEIAKDLNTTVANISQQLRLLQAAGLVKKERTGSAKPGKPRMLFSLSENYAFVAIVSKGLAKKALVRISSKEKEVLKQLIK